MSLHQAAQPVAPSTPRVPRAARLPLLLIVLSVLVALGIWATPTLLWAYHLQQAGGLMERGLVWLEPRYADSLPAVGDQAALEQAIGYLHAAQGYRPAHAHAFRLEGQIYAAFGDLWRAAELFEQAHARAPLNPLAAWEASLMYERMQWAISDSARQPLLEVLVSGRIRLGDQWIYAPNCYPRQTQNCYLERAGRTLSFAGFSNAPPRSVQALLVYDQSRLSAPVEIPAAQTALTFLVGLETAVSPQSAYGQAFRIWVTESDGTSHLVYQRMVEDLEPGWTVGIADLSRWAEQSVWLTLDTPGNLRGTGAPFAWADFQLTSMETAQFIALLPEARKIQAWHAANLTPAHFRIRGNEALVHEQEDAARIWNGRARALENAQQ